LDEKYLDLDNGTRMLDNCPTTDELAKIKEFLQTGQDPERLGNVEKYFLEISTISGLQQRLSCITYKLFFPMKLKELQPDLEIIREASKEMRKSKKLQKIMGIVLSLGNFLNGGTPKGAADGFKFNTLLKLGDTRTIDNKASLLHYLIRISKDKFPSDNLDAFSEDLKSVRPAKTVSLSTVTSEIADLKKRLTETENSLKSIPKIEGNEDIFHKVMPKAIKKCRVHYEQLEKLFEEAEKEFQKTANMFGENGKVVKSEEFFETVVQFLDLWQKTSKEIEEQRIKEEKLKRRTEEEEKKQKLKREKEVEQEERRKREEEALEKRRASGVTTNVKTEEGVMDNALAALKGGEVFSAKRRQRETKKTEEEALSSIMGTLSDLTSNNVKRKDSNATKDSMPQKEQLQKKISIQLPEGKIELSSSVNSDETRDERRRRRDEEDKKTESTEKSSEPKVLEVEEELKKAEERAKSREERRKKREENEKKEKEEEEKRKEEREERRKKLQELKQY